MDMADDIRKLIMAGIGAVSLVAEKSAEALEELSKRGEEALRMSRTDNGELRHHTQQTAEADDLAARIRALPPDKRAELEKLLAKPTDAEKSNVE